MASKKIGWTLNVQVTDGPKVALTNSITIDAYDWIEVVIANDPAGQATAVEIQPGDVDQVEFLLINSDKFDDPAKDEVKLSYSVHELAANVGDHIKLDAPQLLMGSAVKLLRNSPDTLHFYNSLGDAVTIQILVGRKATTA